MVYLIVAQYVMRKVRKKCNYFRLNWWQQGENQRLCVQLLVKGGAVWMQHLCVKVESGGGKDAAVKTNSENDLPVS